MLTSSVSRKAGGIFAAVKDLSLALARRDDAEVAVLGLEDEFTARDLPEWEPLRPKVFPARGPLGFGFSPPLKKALLSEGADVVHQHGIWMYPSLACLAWASASGKPYIVSPHGMLDPWALRLSAWKKRIASFLFQRKHLERAACIHALCRPEAEAVRAFGLANPVCVVPNGVVLPDESEALPPPLWSPSDDRKVLLYLGRIHPKKGLAELLKGWAEAVRGRPAPSWRLVIAGWDQGGHLDELKALAEQKGITDDVEFIGPLFGESKDASFAGASAFALPSHSEGLPMTVLEAWSHRLPVLMTDACNLPEGFERSAAMRTEPNASSVAGTLLRLFDTPDSELSAMGERGRKLVEERFTWEKVAVDMATVYDWLAGGGDPPPCVVKD